MKKLLAMVLALVMTLSLAVSANAAFKDADKVSDTYEEAVAVLNGMGVFKGYEDGSFQPQGDITRAEVAAIVYRVYTKDVKDAKASLYATYNKFSDMTGAGWAAGYIGYCANAELVKGYPNGTFQPSGKVTGYEVLAMILRAIGYDKNGEFSGSDWALHVAQTAQQAGVLKNIKGVDLNAAATRELVAEMLFRAVADAKMVSYTAAFGYQTVSLGGDKLVKDNATLGKQNFDLDKDTDTQDNWGRPTVTWTYNVGDKETVLAVDPDATFTVATAQCDICKALDESKEAKIVEAYTNGKADKTLLTTYKATATTTKVGAQGELLEYYAVEDGYRLVVIDTYLAKVLKVTDAKLDSQGHVRSEAELELNVYGYENGDNRVIVLKGSDGENFEYKKDEFVLIYVNDKDVQNSEIVKTVTATAKKYTGVAFKANELKLDGEWVKFAEKYAEDEDALKDFGKIDVFYDLYDNVIGTFAIDADKTVVVVDAMYTEGHNKPVFMADLVDTAAETKAYTVDTLNNGAGKYTVDNIKDRATDNATEFKDAGIYDKLYTYTVNEDETLKVVTVDDSTIGTDASTDISNKDRYVYFTNKDNEAGRVRFTDETIFLVHENDGTYTSTTGDKMEDITADNIEVMVSTGYATVVYLFGNIHRVSDVNEVYIPVQDNVYIEEQKIDGEYVLCAGITVINADLKESKAWVPVKDLFRQNPEILDLLHAGMSLKKYGIQVGGFFIDAVYLRGTEVLDWSESDLDKDDYSLQLVTDVKNGTVTLDDGYKTAFNVNKVKDIYVIENGKITTGTKDDVKADRFVHVFWADDSSYYVADKLYVDLDLTNYVETYNDEIAPLVKAYNDADSANQDAQEELKTAQDAVTAAEAKDTDVTARKNELDVAAQALELAKEDAAKALQAYNKAEDFYKPTAKENLDKANAAVKTAQEKLDAAQAAYDAAVKNAAALEAAKAALVKAQAKADAAKKAFDAAKEAVDEFELTNFLLNPYIWDYLDSIN